MKLEQYLAVHKKTHIIFDFDETLFYLLLPWEKCFSLIQDDLVKLDKSFLSLSQGSWSSLQNQLIARFGDTARELIIKNNTAFEMNELRGVEVNNELIPFILSNKEYTFSIWSSNTKPVIEKVLKEHKVYDKFEHIVTRTDVAMLKPHPEGFSLLYDPQINKENYLMVGDSQHDFHAAKSAGIDFLEVNYF